MRAAVRAAVRVGVEIGGRQHLHVLSALAVLVRDHGVDGNPCRRVPREHTGGATRGEHPISRREVDEAHARGDGGVGPRAEACGVRARRARRRALHAARRRATAEAYRLRPAVHVVRRGPVLRVFEAVFIVTRSVHDGIRAIIVRHGRIVRATVQEAILAVGLVGKTLPLERPHNRRRAAGVQRRGDRARARREGRRRRRRRG